VKLTAPSCEIARLISGSGLSGIERQNRVIRSLLRKPQPIEMCSSRGFSGY
jgi:hypothetical protein